MKRILVVMLVGVVAASVQAAGKEKDKKKESQPSAADFFGGMDDGKKKKPAQDDLGEALKGMKGQQAPQEELGPRGSMAEGAATVTLKGLFVAPTIMVTGQGGCVPPKPGQEVKRIEATDYPFILQPFSVCAHLESNRGRPVNVTWKIVTPLGRVVGRSEQRIDFTGRPEVDNVTAYSEMSFPVEGKYFYRLELEGVLMGQIELFELVTRPKAPPPPSVNDLVSP